MYNTKVKVYLAVIVIIVLSISPISILAAATYTNYPEDVVCTPHGDMKTSIGFAWYTGTGATNSTVQLRLAGDTRAFGTDQNMTFTGSNTVLSPYNVHKVTVTGLQPGKKYEYRVGDLAKGFWSTDATSLNSVGTFETAPSNQTNFSFIDLGDINGATDAAMQAFGNSIERAKNLFPNFKFIMQNGDTADNSTTVATKENQWEWFFQNAQANLKNTIWAGTIGNHDTAPNDLNYNQHFNYQKASTTGTYYSFDYSNAHFLVLDTNNNNQAQVDWAKYDVAKNNKKWNMTVFHKPLYTNSSHYAETETRNTWSAPLCDVLGIDLGFTGHDHVYSRNFHLLNGQPVPDSVNIRTNNFVTNPLGTLFVLSNCCASKFYQPELTRYPDYISYSTQPNFPTYIGVTVTADTLTNAVYYYNGTTDVLLETYGIVKNKVPPTAPTNVRTTFNTAAKTATIMWDDKNTNNVRDYVIYDENNQHTLNWTHFMGGTGVKTYTITGLTQTDFAKYKFVVKAVGDKSFSAYGVQINNLTISQPVITLNGLESAAVSVGYTNMGLISKNAFLIVAQYNSSKILVGVSSTACTFKTNQINASIPTVTVPLNAQTSVMSVFIWDNFGNLHPLYAKTIYSK